MCPFCLATIALATASAAATGGLTALAIRTFCKRSHPTNTKGEPNDAHTDR